MDGRILSQYVKIMQTTRGGGGFRLGCYVEIAVLMTAHNIKCNQNPCFTIDDSTRTEEFGDGNKLHEMTDLQNEL